MSLSFFSTIHAKDSMSYNINTRGYQNYGNEKASNIMANGSVVLEGTEVEGILQVNGSLQGKNTSLHSMQINGSVRLEDSIVRENAVINGSLQSTGNQFQKNIAISSQSAVFIDSSLESLNVKIVAGYKGVQIIKLLGNSTIAHDIVFDSEQGEVHLSQDSVIMGRVVGGSVVKL